MVGGDGGSPFEDATTIQAVTNIVIWSDDVVRGIQCEYADGSRSQVHGSTSSRRREDFFLDSGESILHVTVHAARLVDAIQFQTTSGRLSNKFGGSGGSRWSFFGGSRPLMGFKGRCAASIDALEILWSDTIKIEAPYIAGGEIFGGGGGTDFDMLQSNSDGTAIDPFKNTLKAVKIRSAARIDAIGCEYDAPGSARPSSGMKGGSGGTDSSFELREHERIIRVEGRAGNTVNSLQFFTNLRRSSPRYGGDGGEWPFIWTPPSLVGSTDSRQGMSLLCFYGSAGSELDRLAPIWAPDAPDRYELQIDHFDLGQLNGEQGIKVESAMSQTDRFFNSTNTETHHTFTFTETAVRSTKFELTSDSRSKIGGKVSLEVSVGGKMGLPGVTEVEASSKFGIEATAEKEWGRSTTDGQEMSKSWEIKHEDNYTVPPRSALEATSRATGATCQNIRWNGNVIAYYQGGATRKIPVSGTLASALRSSYTVSVKKSPLTAAEQALLSADV